MNNYDTSSTGLNIEFSAFFDKCRSQSEFNDNFIRIDTDGSSALNDSFSRVDTFLFTSWDEVDPENYNKSKVVAIRGYSQGDYAEIIIPTKLGFKRGFNFESYFTNLFYDAPIYARFEINDHEFYIDELLSDCYTYDKQQFLNIISDLVFNCSKFNTEEQKIINDYFIENLPENLEYV